MVDDPNKTKDVADKKKSTAVRKKSSASKKTSTSSKKAVSTRKKSAGVAVQKQAAKKKTATAKTKTSSVSKQSLKKTSRLQVIFNEEVTPALKKEFGFKTDMQVPRVKKIVLNMGVGEAVNDKKILNHAVSDLTKISGQKPVITKARKSVAGFKIREGYPIGCKVTLRGQRMFEFLDRLISIAIPRVRDFRGVSAKSFDGRGNFNMGVKEQIIFPEIEYDKIDSLRGLNITIATSAKSDGEARSLLSAFKFPLRS